MAYGLFFLAFLSLKRVLCSMTAVAAGDGQLLPLCGCTVAASVQLYVHVHLTESWEKRVARSVLVASLWLDRLSALLGHLDQERRT